MIDWEMLAVMFYQLHDSVMKKSIRITKTSRNCNYKTPVKTGRELTMNSIFHAHLQPGLCTSHFDRRRAHGLAV